MKTISNALKSRKCSGSGININKHRYLGAGDAAEFIDCLPSMQEALDSIPI